MRSTPFFKVVGSGNDFILLDCRRRAGPADPARFARRWCDRKRGVGADGLLLVLTSAQASARMRIFNPDGSEAAMCGNGLRCVAWYLAADNGHRALTVQTRAGILSARVVRPERVRTFFGGRGTSGWESPSPTTAESTSSTRWTPGCRTRC